MSQLDTIEVSSDEPWVRMPEVEGYYWMQNHWNSKPFPKRLKFIKAYVNGVYEERLFVFDIFPNEDAEPILVEDYVGVFKFIPETAYASKNLYPAL